MGHVFISYSHRDSKYARALAAHLNEMGFGVWIDERLDYGSQWPHEIQKQLDSCDALILVMTPRSFASDWVQSELQRAKRKLKPMFPLLLEGDEPWLSVESTQYFDVRGETFPDEKFYAALKRVMTPGPASSTLKFKKVKSHPGRPARPSTRTLWTGGAFLLLCVVVAPLSVLAWRFIISNIPVTEPSSNGTRSADEYLLLTETLEIAPASVNPPLSEATDTLSPPTNAPPSPTLSPTSDMPPTVHVLAIYEPVFDGPGYLYEPLVRLEQDTQVTAIGRSWGDVEGDWIQILLPSGGTGWIEDRADRIERNFELDALPGGTVSPVPEAAEPKQIFPAEIDVINSSVSEPYGITWDGNRLWQVSRSENGSLNELDNGGGILRQWPLAGPYSDGLTFDGEYLWYAETNISRVFRIDPNSGQVLQQFHTPGWGNINDLAWDGEFLWAASIQPHRLYKVDPATGEEVASLDGPIPPGYNGPVPSFDDENDTDVYIAGLTFDGLFLWVGETSTSVVMKVNPYTGAVVSYFTPDLRNPVGLAWDGTYLWVSDWSGKIIKYQP